MPSLPNDHARRLYQSLSDRGAKPLEVDDPYYVPLLEAHPEPDPVLVLATRITWAQSESVDLLTGFRGNGKSTQLRRLKHELERQGCRVFLLDMLDYVLMTRPLELSDFLLSLTAALSEAVADDTHLEPAARSYWDGWWDFLKGTKIELSDATAEVGIKGDLGAKIGVGAKIGMRLKTEETFKEKVQEQLRGRLTKVVAEAHAFGTAIVDGIRASQGDPDQKVVVLVDSLEQLRGVGTDAKAVYDSVVELFSTHAESLHFPSLHLVYTVPPYLIALAPNVGRHHGSHAVTAWPNIHVRTRDGAPDPGGLGTCVKVIEARYRNWREVLAEDQLRRLAASSGGDVRDFFRLVRESALALSHRRALDPAARLDDVALNRVEQQLHKEIAFISDEDVTWLAEIHRNKDLGLPSVEDLPTLARFLDSNLIMDYENGVPWYDLHPLLVPEVKRRAADRSNRLRDAHDVERL